MGYCMAQTSLAHTYGNVTCFITEFVKSIFPENYFKTVHISSTIAYKQFSIFQNSKKEFLYKTKPMLIIRPRVNLNDTDVFLYNTLLTTRFDDSFSDIDFGNLQDFVYDTESGANIKFLLNRLKMTFDISLVFESQMEQLNQSHYLKNRMRWDKPFFLQTALESYIPRELFELMGNDINIPLYDENGSVKNFLDHVNGNSVFPITYKMKNSSGNDEFFRFYPANMDTTFTNLDNDDGGKKGLISDMFTTSFSITTEFYATGLYYYFNRKPERIDAIVGEMVTNSKKIIPLFTLNNLHTEKIAEGWNIFAAPIYKVEYVKNGPDVLDLSAIFNYNLDQLIKYHTDNGIPIRTLLIPIVMKDNDQLIEGVDFKIDYDEKVLLTRKINTESTYRLILHINTFYANSILDNLFDMSKEK